jgi:hypothetical protein
MGVHLTAEHTLEFELANLRFDRGQIALDFERGRIVVFSFGELEQLD